MVDNNMKHFCEGYNLKILTKVLICYKIPENLSCINLITNKPWNFQKLCAKNAVTALRMQFHKLKPKLSFYRDYAKFSNETFINSLKVKLGTQSTSPDKNGFLIFCKICTETLNMCHVRGREYGEIKVHLSIRRFQKLL